MKKSFKKIIGGVLILVGIAMLVLLNNSITGNLIGVGGNGNVLSIVGMCLIIVGVIMLMAKDGLEKITEEKASEIEGFILKIAESRDISDDKAVKAIKNQLDLLKDSKYFTDVFHDIDPTHHGARTKQLEDYAQRRLDRATEEYGDKKSGE